MAGLEPATFQCGLGRPILLGKATVVDRVMKFKIQNSRFLGPT